ncbi:SDR family oxidoreductase [Streptomyces sp. G-G2]|uniref:SDR family NAD(P)-dependent oxidoreductase n=1 Tax=Streptomyces sp. G-G2 TaxID=3046201 RepID=UPI0024B8FFB5|nr:SDR family oxidoreductase [Streptomyces sp. G-G2]MDJ0386360.1 SDR family oxidoreductase [Streptomyces sp. G-G2]
MSEPDFAGSPAVVTGGATGIALATARLLLARGARVACLDLNPQDVPSPLVQTCVDVADEHSVCAGVAWAAELLGGIDILVNSAGIGAQGGVEDNPDHEWRRVLEVNVLGVVRTTRAALAYLRRSGAPAIVNTCSIAATTGRPDRALYATSKGAVLAMTRAMATDLVEDSIRVTCVNPGPVVGADEVAAAITSLAGPLSGVTTGTELAVNGRASGPQLRPGT